MTAILTRALRQISRAKGPYAMAGMALALTCLLTGAFGTLLSSLDAAIAKHLGHAQFQIYWKPDANIDEVRAQWQTIRTMPGVDQLIVFTPAQALAELAKNMGGADLSFLDAANPLPPTALASLRVTSADPAPAERLLENLRDLPGVKDVRLKPLQLDIARAAHALSSRIFIPIAVLLCAVIAAVAYLATRLCLEGQRAEVELLRLVGADEWFVRLPWAVSAALTGLAGSLAGLAVLYEIVTVLGPLLRTPPLWVAITPLSLAQSLVTVFLATLMSALGGWLAAKE